MAVPVDVWRWQQAEIIFVDAITYILKDTLTALKDAKIVGKAWSHFAASGARFANASNLFVMFKVGSAS
ncbi:hypothetical protein NEMBOFW57_008101 [Staphylotrichum longicolle]|uniref:Uncharacterized protein n=1 Tax=Staphylotrichum longicolle TaxID=669026 RepID=A0AAD4EQQ4_9PEZI|nr:hypothetical protein NEMBOFW57_008101 [Staphylotrichum longicolle]